MGEVGGKVDAAGHDQCKREHPHLRDGWKAALAHPTVSFAMITSVTTCMAPVAPAV